MSIFERYLTVWVLICIGIGVGVGQVFPHFFYNLAQIEIAHVNLPVGILIWVMIIPMLIKIDFRSLTQIGAYWRGISITLFINWVIKPFSMALLAWFFINFVFAPLLPQDQLNSYVAGLILLATAPCTAMVFVWSRLTNGNPYFTLSQVALNDTIMIIAFAPIIGFLLGLSSITVPWNTLFISVIVYIIVPVIISQFFRRLLLPQGQNHFEYFMNKMNIGSMMALLLMLVLLFAFQGEIIVQHPFIIMMLATPILIQVIFTSSLAYFLNKWAKEKHEIACPSALIGASNFFELAVAAAISLFGFHSGAALATVVGVLVEVPTMLFVVYMLNISQKWYERSL